MPGQNYVSVSLNDELIERIKQLIEQIGTYHSVSEFVSEAVRLRIETLEKTIKIQGDNFGVVNEKQAKRRKNSCTNPKKPKED